MSTKGALVSGHTKGGGGASGASTGCTSSALALAGWCEESRTGLGGGITRFL